MSGVHKLRKAAALLAVCALVVAGCDDDQDAAAPTPSSESSAPAEPSDPAPSQRPAEPTLPPEAKGTSPRAAKAFAGYYVEVLDRALTTGLVKQLRSESAPHCSGCSDYIHFIVGIQRAGGRRIGGDWVVDTSRLSARPADGFVVSLVISSSPYSLRKTRTAPTRRYLGDQFSVSLSVDRRGTSWQISDIFSA